MASRLPRGGRMVEEDRRIGRVLQLIELIATRPRRHLRRDLAEIFPVSERMIQRDLMLIRHALKLPLCHSTEGYYFEELPLLPATHFSFHEALALLLAGQAARRMTGIDPASLAAAMGRLESLFPEEFRPILRRLGSTPAVTAQGGHRQRMLGVLHQALMNSRKVRIRYRTLSRGDEVSRRVVRPYHIMPYVRSWHLIAYCEWRKAVLVFKLDRIREAVILDEGYRIPRNFDIDDYLAPTWGIMRDDATPPEDVMLRFAPDAGRRVAEEHWHKSQRVEELEDGYILFKLHVTITPELVSWLLYHGSKVEVLEPEQLRRRVLEEHRKAADLGRPT